MPPLWATFLHSAWQCIGCLPNCQNMWLHPFWDPRAYFWDILNPDSEKIKPDDNWLSDYLMTRLRLVTRAAYHPANLMFLRDTVHHKFFDKFRITINPFTFRKLLCHVPTRDWKHSYYRDDFISSLRYPFPDDRPNSYLESPDGAYAAAYPSRLALLVHFRSALRYHCSWDNKARDQGMPANSPNYVPPRNAFTLVVGSSQRPSVKAEQRQGGREGRGERGARGCRRGLKKAGR